MRPWESHLPSLCLRFLQRENENHNSTSLLSCYDELISVQSTLEQSWVNERVIIIITLKLKVLGVYFGFPGGASGKEAACQCKRCKRRKFNPWVRKIPWRRAWQPTSVFLPVESQWTEEPDELHSIASQRVEHD